MIELIVNPTAGNGRSMATCEAVIARLKELGVEHVLHQTSHPGHATEIARDAAARGADTVVAIGGDGTVTETAAGLNGSRTALGIIPSGTGNDFIKSAAIPTEWQKALDLILNRPARPVNSGVINNRFFINVCGTGLDVCALDYAEKAKKVVHGILPYLYGVLCAIFTYNPVQMHIEIGDDLVMDGKYMVCSIANGRFFGGGIPIAPQAALTDGMLDVLVVDAVPRWKLPAYLVMLLMGKLTKCKVAHSFLTTHCKLSCSGMRLNLDGEIIPMKSAEFTCQPDALLLHW